MGGVSEGVTSSAHVKEASLDDNISGCNGVGCSGEEALVIDSSVVVSSSSFEARTFGSLSSCGVGCSREEALVIDSSVVVPSNSFEAKTFGSLSSRLNKKRGRL